METVETSVGGHGVQCAEAGGACSACSHQDAVHAVTDSGSDVCGTTEHVAKNEAKQSFQLESPFRTPTACSLHFVVEPSVRVTLFCAFKSAFHGVLHTKHRVSYLLL